ncbi:hypothetical protein DYB32_004986 [Aphanomyces invadans]|uniref:Uncharacterized protein n=1 Tax=Aphanomyces invadans TaxID=157072 RepID=A0A418AVX0_9STRA|nr:hypothetical protein DYB32_004986 [Aphanomyces invadans]
MERVNRLMQAELDYRGDDDGGPQEVLAAKLVRAEEEGLSAVSLEQLRRLLKVYTDVFRLEMSCYPPIKVEPLKVRVKQAASPVKFELHRYPPLHMEYLKGQVGELERDGLIHQNNRSRWACAPLIGPQKDWRLQNDDR